MRLLILIFCCSCFVVSSFAYTIQPYPGPPRLDAKPKLNLVFCPLNYRNHEDFLNDTAILIQRLKQTSPFDQFYYRLDFWYVNISQQQANKIFQQTANFPPLKVRQDFLNHITTRVKPEYKLIIIDAKGAASCAELSSADKISLIILGKSRYKGKNSFAKGFLHELGHALGLRDECVSCNQLCPPGPPNCATTQEKAEEWWGDLVQEVKFVHYIQGCCGNKHYIRPTIASLMNDPDKAEGFGPVNERYLRRILEGK